MSTSLRASRRRGRKGPRILLRPAASACRSSTRRPLPVSGAWGGTTTADESVDFTFTGLANGSYTVTPSKTGFTFSPTSQPVTVNGANVTAVNFTATSVQTWSISGTVSPAASGTGT